MLEHPWSLYKRCRIGDEIKDNWSHGRGGGAGASPILYGVGTGIEENCSHGKGEAKKDHRSYSFCFFSFLKILEILAKDAPERFCSASISSITTAILAS